MSLEQVVRPFQNDAPAQKVPVSGVGNVPVLFVIFAGSGVKTFVGEATLTTTVYVKKYPKEISING